uniref:Integrase zinc-binding domain-containing protein n=1 Tax=Arundo donax TaxID=35708 RepID=A0A0A9AM49_ARUDO
MAISAASPAWVEQVEQSYQNDDHCKSLLEQLLIKSDAIPSYTVHAGVLRYKGRIYIGDDQTLRRSIMDSLHNSSIGGHSGMRATYQDKFAYLPSKMLALLLCMSPMKMTCGPILVYDMWPQ